MPDVAPSPPQPDSRAGGYRPIRALLRPETPFDCTLARTPDGRTVMLVSPALLDGWSGWLQSPDGHVLGIRDLVLTEEGTAAELDWCVEPLDSYLRHRSARAAVSAGEAVTLAVSLLRGLQELAVPRAGPDRSGLWWLTDAGRPVFVCEAGASASGSGGVTTAHLREIARQCGGRVGDALRRIADDLPLALRDGERVEEDLLSLAEAQSLVRDARGPAPLRSPAPTPESAAPPEDGLPEHTGARGWLQRHVEIGVLSEAVDALRLRPRRAHVDEESPDRVEDSRRRAPRRRRGPLVVGAGLAALGIAAGLAWPSTAPPAASEAVPTAEPSTAHPAETTAPEREADPVRVVTGLLEGVAGCAADIVCLGRYLEQPDVAVPTDLLGGGATTVLLDDFGDVAVLEVGEAPSYRVVIARGDDGWRIRSIYTVADG